MCMAGCLNDGVVRPASNSFIPANKMKFATAGLKIDSTFDQFTKEITLQVWNSNEHFETDMENLEPFEEGQCHTIQASSEP